MARKTRKQIQDELMDIPSRVESLKVSDIGEYMERGSRGTKELFTVIEEVYKRGIIDGRMWQQLIDEKRKKTAVMDEGEVYTLQEVSEILKVTYRSVLSYVESGKLPATKIGGKWRVRESDLQSFVKADK